MVTGANNSAEDVSAHRTRPSDRTQVGNDAAPPIDHPLASVSRADLGILSGGFQRQPGEIQLASANGSLVIPQEIRGTNYPTEARLQTRDARRPGEVVPGQSSEISPNLQRDFSKWLDNPNNGYDRQLRETLADLSHMRDGAAKTLAIESLKGFLQRGDSDYVGPKDGTRPHLDAKVIGDTLGNLNTALASRDGSDLNSMFGGTPEARARARDQIVAQFLANADNLKGIKQGHHNTCVADGKINNEMRERPDVAAGILAQALTTHDGTVKMPNGNIVSLDSSFTHDDRKASNTWLMNRNDQSFDTRVLTGIYINALTQPKGLTFKMDVANGPMGNKTGDRLFAGDESIAAVDGNRNIYFSHNINDRNALDAPITNADDSKLLQKATGDGEVIVTNPDAWHAHADGRNLIDVRTANLADLVRQHNGVQVGLNAHILFGDPGSTAGGGHLTNISAVENRNGENFYYIHDSNNDTSAWYSEKRVLAAINNNPNFRATERLPGETARIFDRPANERFISVPAGPGRPEYIAPRGQMVSGDAHPDLQTKAQEHADAKDKDPKKKAEDDTLPKVILTNDERDRRKQELQMAAGLLAQRQAEEQRRRDEEAARQRQQMAYFAALNAGRQIA
jgi:hypothetical protein